MLGILPGTMGSLGSTTDQWSKMSENEKAVKKELLVYYCSWLLIEIMEI